VYPNGHDLIPTAKDFLSIYFNCSDVPAQVFFQASVLNSNGEEKGTKSFFRLITCSRMWGWPKFFERKVLLEKSNNLLKYGVLTLSCEVILNMITHHKFHL
jgi:hypothetical protein